ncbi:MAG: iron-containing alcohol dehydrogenase [Aeromonadaceae bacterium]
MECRTHSTPEYLLGCGAIEALGDYLIRYESKRVLLVTDPGVIEAGWLDRVLLELQRVKIEHSLFYHLTPNPKDAEVMAGAEFYLQQACDLVVVVGGGSPMDCAKGICALVGNGGALRRFAGVDHVPKRGPHLICIPTTAGTGSEVSRFAIITDTQSNVKFAIVSPTMVPTLALIDPITTTTMPAELTATTGMDALVHAIEAYVSTASSPLSDLYALEAIRLISASLRQAMAHPLELQYRESMMLGSLLAGLAFTTASLGLVHAMAHSLGGLLDLAHGECNALLLEYVVAYNFVASPARFQQVGEAMGLPMRGLNQAEQKVRLVAALASLRRDVNLAHPLRDLGVKLEDIPLLAENALADPCILTNPLQPTLEEVVHIYEQAL